jgi:hypothetical protein
VLKGLPQHLILEELVLMGGRRVSADRVRVLPGCLSAGMNPLQASRADGYAPGSGPRREQGAVLKCREVRVRLDAC